MQQNKARGGEELDWLPVVEQMTGRDGPGLAAAIKRHTRDATRDEHTTQDTRMLYDAIH